MGGPHLTLGVDSEDSAVFRDTVFEAFRRLAPFSLPPDHFASHDDVGEAIVVHARDAAGVVEDALHYSSLNALTVSFEEDLEFYQYLEKNLNASKPSNIVFSCMDVSAPDYSTQQLFYVDFVTICTEHQV